MLNTLLFRDPRTCTRVSQYLEELTQLTRFRAGHVTNNAETKTSLACPRYRLGTLLAPAPIPVTNLTATDNSGTKNLPGPRGLRTNEP